jgi:hypothetical protein
LNEAKVAWVAIREIHAKIQMIVSTAMFERRVEEEFDAGEWEDPGDVVPVRACEGEEDENDDSSSTDTSSG